MPWVVVASESIALETDGVDGRMFGLVPLAGGFLLLISTAFVRIGRRLHQMVVPVIVGAGSIAAAALTWIAPTVHLGVSPTSQEIGIGTGLPVTVMGGVVVLAGVLLVRRAGG